jgi:transposase
MVLSTTFQPLLQAKMTLAHLWQAMMAFLLYGHLRRSTLKQLTQRRFQIRFT